MTDVGIAWRDEQIELLRDMVRERDEQIRLIALELDEAVARAERAEDAARNLREELDDAFGGAGLASSPARAG